MQNKVDLWPFKNEDNMIKKTQADEKLYTKAIKKITVKPIPSTKENKTIKQ